MAWAFWDGGDAEGVGHKRIQRIGRNRNNLAREDEGYCAIQSLRGRFERIDLDQIGSHEGQSITLASLSA